jgi:hypothetical protein
MTQKWNCTFKSFNGTTCEIRIYTNEAYSGTPIALTGTQDPVKLEETNDVDVSKPVRYFTGYMSFVESYHGELDELQTYNSTARYVEIYYGSVLFFKGFISNNLQKKDISDYPVVRKFQIVSILSLDEILYDTFLPSQPLPIFLTMESIFINVLSITQRYMATPYTSIIMPRKISGYISPYVLSPYNEDFHHYSYIEEDYYTPLSVVEILEQLSIYMGCVLHEVNNVLIFQSANYTEQYYIYSTTLTHEGRLQQPTQTTFKGNDVMNLLSGISYSSDRISEKTSLPIKKITHDYKFYEYEQEPATDFLLTADPVNLIPLRFYDNTPAQWITPDVNTSRAYTYDSVTFWEDHAVSLSMQPGYTFHIDLEWENDNITQYVGVLITLADYAYYTQNGWSYTADPLIYNLSNPNYKDGARIRVDMKPLIAMLSRQVLESIKIKIIFLRYNTSPLPVKFKISSTVEIQNSDIKYFQTVPFNEEKFNITEGKNISVDHLFCNARNFSYRAYNGETYLTDGAPFMFMSDDEYILPDRRYWSKSNIFREFDGRTILSISEMYMKLLMLNTDSYRLCALSFTPSLDSYHFMIMKYNEQPAVGVYTDQACTQLLDRPLHYDDTLYLKLFFDLKVDTNYTWKDADENIILQLSLRYGSSQYFASLDNFYGFEGEEKRSPAYTVVALTPNVFEITIPQEGEGIVAKNAFLMTECNIESI